MIDKTTPSTSQGHTDSVAQSLHQELSSSLRTGMVLAGNQLASADSKRAQVCSPHIDAPCLLQAGLQKEGDVLHLLCGKLLCVAETSDLPKQKQNSGLELEEGLEIPYQRPDPEFRNTHMGRAQNFN